jgi:hypothetical protein
MDNLLILVTSIGGGDVGYGGGVRCCHSRKEAIADQVGAT